MSHRTSRESSPWRDRLLLNSNGGEGEEVLNTSQVWIGSQEAHDWDVVAAALGFPSPPRSPVGSLHDVPDPFERDVFSQPNLLGAIGASAPDIGQRHPDWIGSNDGFSSCTAYMARVNDFASYHHLK